MINRYDPLVVYMPVVHGGRAGGFARSLDRIGMRMMVTGPTAEHNVHFDNRFRTEQVQRTFGANVFATEGDEIMTEAPDIIVVGREDNLTDSLALRRRLSAVKPVSIVAYSGVYQSRFEYKKLDGVIATDNATRVVARYRGIPALKYFPAFDFERWRKTPEPDSSCVILRSFIRNYEKRFPIGYAFHQECKARLAEEFGDRVLIENYESVPSDEVKRLTIESTATLHLKDNEGFGWSTLESLSLGRPILWQAGLSRGMAFREWMPKGGEDFAFRTVDDLVRLVTRLIEDEAWRKSVQDEAAAYVRAVFDNERNALNLGDFLMAIHGVTKAAWAPWRKRGPRPEINRYEATLDPTTLQHFEEVALGGRMVSDLPDV